MQMRRQTDAGKRSAVKVACCVWRGAHGKVPLPGRQLVGCLPYRVEHAGNLYVSRRSGQAERGYYFIAADDSTVCGLCAGMQVRL